MIDWLALILLIPLTLVPIVLLFGFAGCGFEVEANPGGTVDPPPDPPPDPPIFEKAFEATLAGDEQRRNRCIVQRIEPVRLLKSGSEVRITLQRPTAGNLLIKSITISHAADTPGADLYDSAGDLRLVPGPFPLLLLADPGNAAVELMPVSFPLDQMKPLLLAFDIDDPGNVRRSAPGTEADTAAFVGPLQNPPLHEAAIPGGDRGQSTGYNPEERTYLVQRIDVRVA